MSSDKKSMDEDKTPQTFLCLFHPTAARVVKNRLSPAVFPVSLKKQQSALYLKRYSTKFVL
jgi:hypothetical protein